MYLSRIGAIKLLQGGAILVHNPIGPLPFGCTTSVEHQSLLHSNQNHPRLYFTILPGRLPIPMTSCSVQSMPIWVLSVLWTEEEPFRILVPYHRQIYKTKSNKQIIKKKKKKKL
ncbi:hypothetical protein V8G54_007831 [Vigna mungo]|uniref:Uncharacterized protein n=1 Tax=Vigna mungo TaxID=3915 RepID=A0AAQ3S9G2_VIGMU